jgi:hypothetical protein
VVPDGLFDVAGAASWSGVAAPIWVTS